MDLIAALKRPEGKTLEFKRHSGVYVRVGSTNRRADPALVDEMRRFANRQAYDERPLPQFHSEAVDFRAASE